MKKDDSFLKILVVFLRGIIKVDKCFPSSPIYSNCGYKDDNKSLKIREWTCHIRHNRDINASINILMLYSTR